MINETIKGSVICIAGAGGSIGSQLCREALKNKPKQLIILDINEENLYNIGNEFNEINNENIDIKFFLGSATMRF